MKAAPRATEREAARVPAAILESLDHIGAMLVPAKRSRTEDADIVFIQRACATSMQDGLVNELVGHGHPLLPFKATRCLSASMQVLIAPRLVDINATALKAAIIGSMLADPEACFVMMIASPLGSTVAVRERLASGHELR
jgi:hypothetical protein